MPVEKGLLLAEPDAAARQLRHDVAQARDMVLGLVAPDGPGQAQPGQIAAHGRQRPVVEEARTVVGGVRHELAAPEAEEGSADASPVTMARTQGSLAEGVSTVDDPDLPMGRAAIVLALDEQLDGGSGHYGIGAGADAPVPEGA